MNFNFVYLVIYRRKNFKCQHYRLNTFEIDKALLTMNAQYFNVILNSLQMVESTVY
jgi:hypothetical protein